MTKEKLKEKVADVKCALKTKWTNFKLGAKQLGHDFKELADDNPGEALGLLTAAVVAAGWIGNTAIKAADHSATRRSVKRERRAEDCDVYDNRTATHWETKRPLTNNEKAELEQRYMNGETKGEVLKDMKLLKR